MKISVVISACNEEKKIKECLESVKWADEIIFVDNNSNDKTVEIAKKYTSKIFSRQNNLMLNVNKNYGFSKVSNEWVLNLDADERVSDELASEIKSVIVSSDAKDGYFIPRKNIIFGKWMEHTGWYPDYQLRLFKKGKGRFPEKQVHEKIEVNGQTEYLKNDLVHLNYETVLQFLQKLGNIYAANEADQLIKNGYKFNWLDVLRFPVNEFLSRFFAREGYKDGFHGLVVSVFMAFYHFVVFAYIWEKQGFSEIEVKNILAQTEKELKKTHAETMYWFLNQKIKEASHPLKKIMLRIKRKLL